MFAKYGMSEHDIRTSSPYLVPLVLFASSAQNPPRNRVLRRVVRQEASLGRMLCEEGAKGATILQPVHDRPDQKKQDIEAVYCER